jgi:hypothetical protein
VSDVLGMPGLDSSRNQLSLVNGSARIKKVPQGGIVLARLADSLRSAGCTVEWDPTTGNNGMNLKLADTVALQEMRANKADTEGPKNRKKWERSAMVFSNGYVKIFALNEEQLARLVLNLSDTLRPLFDCE